MSKDKDLLRQSPLIPPTVLSRTLGISQHAMYHKARAFGILPDRATKWARSYFSFEQAEAIAKKLGVI